MRIETRYAVDKFFPNSAFAQVFYEAVANAFDADATEIDIRIESDGALRPPGVKITIADNGAGFDDERFGHFARLQQPKDRHHKGLGRLVYLKYFKRVEVESFYSGFRRTFVFEDDFDGDSCVEVVRGDHHGSTLVFESFAGDRIKSYDDLRPQTIKTALVNQFLPLLYRKTTEGVAFEIRIVLDTDQDNAQHHFFNDTVTVTARDIPLFEERIIEDPALGLFERVRMSFLVDDQGGDGSVVTLASVDSRSVPVALVRARPLPPNTSAVFLFESAVFDGTSDSERQVLDLPKEIPRAPLYQVLRREVGLVLEEHIPTIRQRNERTQQHFRDKYPHLVGLFDKEFVGVIDRDQAIAAAQQRFFEQQKSVLESAHLDDDTYRRSLEVSARTLAEYILYRDLIIKRLEALSKDDPEAAVHNVIVPQYTQYAGGDFVEHLHRNNAWLLDDRFMTYRTLLSDSRMQRVVAAITLEEEKGAGGDGRPDIAMVFSADPKDDAPVDAVIIEMKRRIADDKDGLYAITQLTKRARLVVEHCPNIQRMWYFGIIEIDEALGQILIDQGWAPLFSRGRVFYRDFKIDGVLAPTYVMSFESMIADAFARNHTFLEILKSEIERS